MGGEPFCPSTLPASASTSTSTSIHLGTYLPTPYRHTESYSHTAIQPYSRPQQWMHLLRRGPRTTHLLRRTKLGAYTNRLFASASLRSTEAKVTHRQNETTCEPRHMACSLETDAPLASFVPVHRSVRFQFPVFIQNPSRQISRSRCRLYTTLQPLDTAMGQDGDGEKRCAAPRRSARLCPRPYDHMQAL